MSATEKPHVLSALPLLASAAREAAAMEKTVAAISDAMDMPRAEVLERLQRAIDTPVTEPLRKSGPRADEDGSYEVFTA